MDLKKYLKNSESNEEISLIEVECGTFDDLAVSGLVGCEDNLGGVKVFTDYSTKGHVSLIGLEAWEDFKLISRKLFKCDKALTVEQLGELVQSFEFKEYLLDLVDKGALN